MRSPLADRWGLTALAAVALLATSCVQQAEPGVQVKALEADLVFGVKPLARAVPPANFPIAAAPPALPLPPLTAPVDGSSVGEPPLTVAQPCPKARIGSFPKEAAGLNVLPSDRPALGSYRWMRSGSRQGPETLGYTIPITGSERRLVRNLVATSATKFSYETVQTDLVSRETVVTTWQVTTNGTSTAGQVPDVVPARPPSAGEPERGVVIKKIVRSDAKGTVTSTFTPQFGLLVLPLTVRAGDSFTSTAVDPVSFQTLQFQGTVQPMQRLDACGELVEAWPVKGTLTFTGARTDTADYTAYVAPQLGGLLVGEVLNQTAAAGFLKATWTIGQVIPDAAAAKAPA
jgi:hypothetical protein